MTVQPRPRRSKRAQAALRSGAMTGAAAGIILLAAGCTTAEGETTGETSDASARTGAMKDGSYSAEGAYTSPGGHQKVKVELTLADGVIDDIDVTPEAVDPQSERFQTDFADHVAQQVEGKTLAEADVSVVASSSLTSQGFNQALDKIAAEAGA